MTTILTKVQRGSFPTLFHPGSSPRYTKDFHNSGCTVDHYRPEPNMIHMDLQKLLHRPVLRTISYLFHDNLRRNIRLKKKLTEYLKPDFTKI